MTRKKQSRGTRAVFWSNGFRKILFDKVHGWHPDIQNDELHGLNATITRTTTQSISCVILHFETVQTVEKVLRNLTDILKAIFHLVLIFFLMFRSDSCDVPLNRLFFLEERNQVEF
jgi:uncharacterized membrane protein